MYVGWVVNLDQDAAHIPSRPQRQNAFVEKSAEARRSSTTYAIIRFALRLTYTDHLIPGCLANFRAAGDRQRVYLTFWKMGFCLERGAPCPAARTQCKYL